MFLTGRHFRREPFSVCSLAVLVPGVTGWFWTHSDGDQVGG